MKKFLNILGTLLVICVSAQTNLTDTQHYIYTKTCLTGDCTKTSETVQYFDSFGKPFQTVSIKSSPTGKDMVQHIPYDRFARSVDSWNPVPMSSLGGALQDSSAVKNAAVSVYGDSRPFSHTVLEKSTIGRPLSSIPSGQEWQNHPVTMGYYANKANEVKKYTVTTGWTDGRTDDVLSLSGFYAANTLVKTSVTDQDGNKSIEYKNKAGQVVLVKKGAGTADEANTYYVYNDYNQLAFVIPPLAVNAPMNQATYDKLCYQYRYDGWNRMVEKKLPGKGWEYVIYDQQDRPIMTQDANLRTTDNTFGVKGWMVTKYDKLGRTVYTGFFASTDSRAVLQNNVSSLTVNAENNEARSSSSFTTNGMAVYYTQNAFPAGAITVLSVNYYDTYPAYSFNPAFPTSIFGQEIMTDAANAPVSTKTLPTLSLVKNIEDNNWIKSYVWYDTKGRAVATYSINHLGGYTRTESEINFAGWVKQTKAYHKRLTADSEKQITQTFEYDDQGRLKKQYHQVGSNPQELLAENTYNELSQLVNKKTGNNLQSIDYTYDIKGTLKKINNPANLNGKLFAYEMKSNVPANAAAKYNGNITEIDWRTSSDNVLKRYTYQYDGLSRLQKAIYSEPNASVPQNDFYNEELTYDLGGNIQTLKRNSQGSPMKEQIDDLVYTYDGNRLQTVVDHSANYGGYPDISGNLITYDDNGNMTSQKDKGILEIKYNVLNLPDNIKFDKTYRPRLVGFDTDYHVKSKYLYSADGVKLRKSYTYGTGRANFETSTITDYLDGFQYEEIYAGTLSSPILKFVPTSEGYYDFEKNQYIYSYTDHLGNVRLSYFRNTTSGSADVLEENNYYAFGMKHDLLNNPIAVNPAYNYQYNGKELQTETGWNDYGWRQYMPEIGRWNGMDQLSENYYSDSPYAYVLNNPVMMFDPDGRLSQSFINNVWNSSSGTTWYNNNNGTFTNSWGDMMSNNGEALNFDSSKGHYWGRTGFVNVNLEQVNIPIRGNEKTWNSSSNLGYNRLVLDSKILSALAGWNYDVNSSNMGQYILNSKASRETAEFEKFLFLEVPASFAGGELLMAGWRAANLSRLVCGPLGRLSNGLLKICFTEGTLVATEKGNKRIEDIKEGDLVWSYNEETGKKELKKVVALSRNTSSSLVKITVNGTEITCTPEHPFYVNGSWIEAKDLTKGMLLTTLNRTTSPVESIKFLDEKVKVYNFEVEGNHNYYVSENGVLVHNNCEWLEGTLSQVKGWIPTEPGMQGSKAVDDIAARLMKNDPYVFKEPIKVVEAEGKTFILDGHHRIQAAIKAGYEGPIPYQRIPTGQISQHSIFRNIGELLETFGH